jgi:hypothetical protein
MISLWPATGGYDPDGYRAGFGVFLAVEAVAWAWTLVVIRRARPAGRSVSCRGNRCDAQRSADRIEEENRMNKLFAAVHRCAGVACNDAGAVLAALRRRSAARRIGAADERGAANRMRPETVLRATRLIKTGEVIELGCCRWTCLCSARAASASTQAHRRPMGTNRRYTSEELVITELGQVGTQFDMFSHQSIDGLHYNCIKTDDIATRSGSPRSAWRRSELVHARRAGRCGCAQRCRHAAAGHEITVDDMQAALAKEG